MGRSADATPTSSTESFTGSTGLKHSVPVSRRASVADADLADMAATASVRASSTRTDLTDIA